MSTTDRAGRRRRGVRGAVAAALLALAAVLALGWLAPGAATASPTGHPATGHPTAGRPAGTRAKPHPAPSGGLLPVQVGVGKGGAISINVGKTKVPVNVAKAVRDLLKATTKAATKATTNTTTNAAGKAGHKTGAKGGEGTGVAQRHPASGRPGSSTSGHDQGAATAGTPAAPRASAPHARSARTSATTGSARPGGTAPAALTGTRGGGSGEHAASRPHRPHTSEPTTRAHPRSTPPVQTPLGALQRSFDPDTPIGLLTTVLVALILSTIAVVKLGGRRGLVHRALHRSGGKDSSSHAR